MSRKKVKNMNNSQQQINLQEKELLREHIKMLSEKAAKADTAADLQLLTSAICTAVVTLQNLN